MWHRSNQSGTIRDPEPVFLDESRKISKPQPPDKFCKTKGCTNWEPDANCLCKHCEKNKGRMCPECGKELPLSQAAKAKTLSTILLKCLRATKQTSRGVPHVKLSHN
jgi:hypothetical protein